MTEQLAKPLGDLIWAGGRLGATDPLLPIATTRPEMPFDRDLRQKAVRALILGKPNKAALATLDKLAGDDDPEIRAMAAEAVVEADPARSKEVTGRLLSDRVAFNRVARHDGAGVMETLRGAVGQIHYQGVTVPQLSSRQDVATLAATAGNASLTEETRIGAVEGLAAMASEAAEAELVRIGQATENPEELRKAAWRGRRRSVRARKKVAAKEVAK